MNAHELAQLIRSKKGWDKTFLEQLCEMDGLKDEWKNSNENTFEDVAYKAAEILDVDIDDEIAENFDVERFFNEKGFLVDFSSKKKTKTIISGYQLSSDVEDWYDSYIGEVLEFSEDNALIQVTFYNTEKDLEDDEYGFDTFFTKNTEIVVDYIIKNYSVSDGYNYTREEVLENIEIMDEWF